MTLIQFIFLLVVAGVCGSVGQALAGGPARGCLVSVVLGFIGALFGTWMAQVLRLPEPFVVFTGRQGFPILWSIIGSAVFVALLSLLSKRRF